MRNARLLLSLSLPLALIACNSQKADNGMSVSSGGRSVMVIELDIPSSASVASAMSQVSLAAASSMPAMQSSQAQASEMAMVLGAYTDYRSDVLTNGQEKVLFFHAAWCPICRTQDTELKAWYGSDAGKFVTTYKVDYDTEKDLKAKYGVTYQHTFVRVDGQGNVLTKVQGPNDEQLTALLTI
jgi:thioredoxin 1